MFLYLHTYFFEHIKAAYLDLDEQSIIGTEKMNYKDFSNTHRTQILEPVLSYQLEDPINFSENCRGATNIMSNHLSNSETATIMKHKVFPEYHMPANSTGEDDSIPTHMMKMSIRAPEDSRSQSIKNEQRNYNLGLHIVNSPKPPETGIISDGTIQIPKYMSDSTKSSPNLISMLNRSEKCSFFMVKTDSIHENIPLQRQHIYSTSSFSKLEISDSNTNITFKDKSILFALSESDSLLNYLHNKFASDPFYETRTKYWDLFTLLRELRGLDYNTSPRQMSMTMAAYEDYIGRIIPSVNRSCQNIIKHIIKGLNRSVEFDRSTQFPSGYYIIQMFLCTHCFLYKEEWFKYHILRITGPVHSFREHLIKKLSNLPDSNLKQCCCQNPAFLKKLHRSYYYLPPSMSLLILGYPEIPTTDHRYLNELPLTFTIDEGESYRLKSFIIEHEGQHRTLIQKAGYWTLFDSTGVHVVHEIKAFISKGHKFVVVIYEKDN